jgi:hypothetical protein
MQMCSDLLLTAFPNSNRDKHLVREMRFHSEWYLVKLFVYNRKAILRVCRCRPHFCKLSSIWPILLFDFTHWSWYKIKVWMGYEDSSSTRSQTWDRTRLNMIDFIWLFLAATLGSPFIWLQKIVMVLCYVSRCCRHPSVGLVYGVECHFPQYIGFIGEGNRSKPQTCRRSLTNFIT